MPDNFDASKKLPDNPAELIRLAVVDLALAAASKDYEVNMMTWHRPGVFWDKHAKCEVCFAGSVMAFSLDVARQEACDPDTFDDETENKLLALDSFRQGEIKVAYDHLGRDFPKYLAPVVKVADYEGDSEGRDTYRDGATVGSMYHLADPSAFIVDMLDMADAIEHADATQPLIPFDGRSPY